MALALTLATAASGCVQPAVKAAGPVLAAPLRVSGEAAPFRYDEGAAAKRAGAAICTARGQRLKTSIYDRFEAGDWVFVEGCA